MLERKGLSGIHRTVPRLTRARWIGLWSMVAWVSAVGVTRAAITESQVLVVYNSASAEGTALKNSYLAAHPGIPANHVFDLNNPAMLTGDILYSSFISQIRTPIRNYLTSLGAAETQGIIAMALIRPFPHRIWDTDNPFVGDDPFGLQGEFLPPGSGGQGDATCASVDAELVLLWQNLDTGEAGGTMDSKSDNLIDNPYHQSASEINFFTRGNIQTAKTYVNNSNVVWNLGGAGATQLTPGDMYLVCRIDGPSLAAAQASITRAQQLYANKASQIALLDAYAVSGSACPDLDNSALFPSADPQYAGNDYDECRTALQAAGWTVRLDNTANFIDSAEETRALIAFATYGENHSLFGCGEDPLGSGVYPTNGYRYARGAIFNPLESYSGRSLNGIGQQPSIPQGQVADFIAAGGTFAIGNVWEPLSSNLADNEFAFVRMLVQQRTWAEAAYSAIPGLSWQHVVLGDPLGRFAAILNDPGLPKGDMDANGVVDGRDIQWFVNVMTSGISAYRAAFPTRDPIARGDFDNDLQVTASDVPGFMAALLAP